MRTSQLLVGLIMSNANRFDANERTCGNCSVLRQEILFI